MLVRSAYVRQSRLFAVAGIDRGSLPHRDSRCKCESPPPRMVARSANCVRKLVTASTNASRCSSIARWRCRCRSSGSASVLATEDFGKPRISGLWQGAARRRKLPFSEWVKLDPEHIESCSLALDLRILLSTVAILGKGAQ